MSARRGGNRMQIEFMTDWRFRATVDGGIRTFSVTNPINTPSGRFLLYVDEAKALMGEYEVLAGRLVEKDGVTLLEAPVTEDPLAAHLLDAMRRMTLDALRRGELPIGESPDEDDEWDESDACDEYDEDEDDGAYDAGDQPDLYDPSQDVAPETECPVPDMTPEERLLRAIFNEPVTEGVAQVARDDRLAALILSLEENDDGLLTDDDDDPGE